MKPNKLQFWLLGIFVAILVMTALVCGTHIQNEISLLGNITSERSDKFGIMLMPISDVSSSDVLLDISENSTKHIKGSVVIPYTEFILGGGLLKSVPEIAQILGNAGISRSDKVVVYGECLVCGGGPAPATYVYWMMKCLGHQDIWVLDGTVEDWAAAGGPTSNESVIRPSTNYTPGFNADLFATYGYVKSNKAQIVDARLPEEFEAGSIPGAISIPYDNVLDGHKIKNETGLERAFINLSKDRPVVVFTDTGIKASVVWFALKLMGYDALMYSWQNWIDNQPLENNTTNSSSPT
ncbi:MAG: rhodanese-like domain-containing protein [Methanotrichaceae archaeon]